MLQQISWIGADDAARAIVDLREASSTDATPYIAHLTHSRPVSANALFEPLAKVLGVRLVPFAEWVETLEKSAANSDDEKNPALKMIDFFKDNASKSASESYEAYGVVRMDITNALKGSKTLREDIAELSVGDVTSWVSYWRRVGHL